MSQTPLTTTSRRELHARPDQEGQVTRLVIMGPQGAGKGTQAARLAEVFGIVPISTGDLFRANIARKTELGKVAQEYTTKGDLVPDEVTNAMLRERLAEGDVKQGFILDGYPRNAAQVPELDGILAELGWELDGVIELTADRTELLTRIAKRAKEEGRDDDTEEAIIRRLDIYAEQTAPLTAAYDERNLLVRVDGLGEVAEVTDRIVASLATQLG